VQAAPALERWHEFYVLLGTAGATLVALLFVAISLGSGFLTEERADATRAFFSPVVVHFMAVFFISAIGLFPAHDPTIFASLVGLCALIGGGVSLITTIQLLRHRWTRYVRDHLAYGLLPLICYAALLAAAAMIAAEHKDSLLVLAGALLLLLIVNVRNAWDLTLSMVRRQAHSGKS
jgi:peptidoglycan/LPS O-acetylase OafA/YrhL